MTDKPIDILLVEDNPGDVDLVKKALQQHKIIVNLHHVTDGEQALAFLHREGDFAQAIRPDVIFLDLNLPGLDGREVLAAVKRDEELKAIPVVVLTSSEAEEDVLKSYELQANCFVTKPVELGQFMKVVQEIEEFWVQIVQLPRK